jgi:hypothetical protein
MHMVIKYLIINQHDESYTILDKWRIYWLVIMLKMHQNASPKTLLSLQQILSFKLDTKMTIVFFNYIYNYLIITITR